MFLCDVNLFQGLNLYIQSSRLTKNNPWFHARVILCATHTRIQMKTGTHLAHYFNVGDPLSSCFAPLVRLNRQDKVSRFGQRLSYQEGPRLVPRTEELLCVWPGQVTVVPPGSDKNTDGLVMQNL